MINWLAEELLELAKQKRLRKNAIRRKMRKSGGFINASRALKK